MSIRKNNTNKAHIIPKKIALNAWKVLVAFLYNIRDAQPKTVALHDNRPYIVIFCHKFSLSLSFPCKKGKIGEMMPAWHTNTVSVHMKRNIIYFIIIFCVFIYE